MKDPRHFAIQAAPLLTFGALLVIFGAQNSKFLEPQNLLNIVAQASSTGILAIGMTFVLLTGGVDLSVGAAMFVAAAIAGKLSQSNAGFPFCFFCVFLCGFAFASFNALFIVRIRIAPFIVTLATLFIGRGLGLRITQTRAINMPDTFLQIGSATIAGIPLPVWIFASLLCVGHILLTLTPFGRQVLAIGHNAEAARKAGLRTNRVLFVTYALSSICAAIAALVTLGQLGAVSPKFGEQKEFAAIAAAVLGGTSLFGGRGNILPGALVGSLLIQTVENGLVLSNANPYIYPMVTSVVIFAAILLESVRKRSTINV